MRTMGDCSWVNGYIGIPYLPNGRDRDGLDCYGLVKLVCLERYQKELPDWLIDHIDARGRNEIIESVVTSGEFIEKDTPCDGDIVVCYRTRAAYHVGVYVGGSVLHSHDGVGVICEHIGRFSRRFVRVVFGEWNP